jgi:hypothetical protein
MALNRNYVAVYTSAEWAEAPTYHLMAGNYQMTLCGMPTDGDHSWYGKPKLIRLPWMQKIGYLCEKCRVASIWHQPL